MGCIAVCAGCIAVCVGCIAVCGVYCGVCGLRCGVCSVFCIFLVSCSHAKGALTEAITHPVHGTPVPYSPYLTVPRIAGAVRLN